MSADEIDRYIANMTKLYAESGQKGEYWRNYAVARGVLREEKDLHPDQLLVNARQDAAHVLCNTKAIMDGQKRIRRTLIAILLMQALILAYLITR